MSRFDDLSDIVNVEETFDLHEEKLERRDSIVEGAVDVDKSMSVFEKKMVDSHVTDFSDRIDRLDHTYETYEVKETLANKISRIRKELEELEDEIEKEDLVNEKEEVAKLQEVFQKLNTRTKDKKIVKLDDALQIDSSEPSAPLQIQQAIEDPFKIEEYDKRLNKLEKAIGEERMDKSIQTLINDLFRKFKLLSNDEDSLEKIKEIIDQVNHKFEKSITTRRSLDPSIQHVLDEDAKINEIYTKFTQTQEFSNDLPFLIKRLESLNELHLKVNNSVQTVDSMEHDLDKFTKDLESWDENLIKLESKLDTLNESFELTKTKHNL
ncbi:putative dynactin subunit 2 [Wickerhamomyces ciferrii]|uniref:Dynactin subunit 2 n=1 Tax=Wickerhamomyces ciferrii (strain ATCC 14091 / BCRC 22168 / CBS 111 / JCM 3599 / NBRC 0793 / NRRL Y-1031 F-60-10) TaxID=1206466 RepID=K0KHI8_WICCF|nr:putative dynactin subunit 2 [Wickerhamomyces ciferrii]CCH41642.1 putative dynactin subunit 2 [Wickerhamomyces ciferrii]